jgi:signal transduction histidine kinase
LLSAIKAFTGKIAESKIISLEIDGNIEQRRFHQNIEITLYRVLCELISNTLRHSTADSIYIRLLEADGYLFVNYRDNGKALPAGFVLTGHSGMGFSNIESRLKAVNGKIELDNPDHKGFAVSITCPLQEHS